MNKTFILSQACMLLFILTCGCQPENQQYQKISGKTQGTFYNITYKYTVNTNLQPEIQQVLRDFDLSLSSYEPKSIISKINSNKPDVKVDDLFIEVFREARKVYENTDGAFDITIAPLVNAWGFGFIAGQNADSILIDSLLQFVGMEKVSLKEQEILKEQPEVMLDVNAIAQGYSADVVAKYLEDKNIENFLVEIGGEIHAKGKNPKGQDWKVGIDKPVDGNMVPGQDLKAIVKMRNTSLATSGNYRKFFEKDGVKYAHSINPKTGYPVLSRLLSATVISKKCMTADAYATAFMVMGLEKSIEFLEAQNTLDAYLIYSDKEGKLKVYTTEGMKSQIIEEM